MSRLMFVFLSGTEKGKTRIFTQQHITLGTSDECDLKLVAEEGGRLPDGVLADIFSEEGLLYFAPRTNSESIRITVSGQEVLPEDPAGHPLKDGDTIQLGEGLSSASLLFQVLPHTFHGTQLVTREKRGMDTVQGQSLHPLTATLFVKELVASLWAEIPKKAKTVALVSVTLFVAISIFAFFFNFLALHRNASEIELIRQQTAVGAAQRQQDQETIKKQQEEIDRLRLLSEQTRLFAQNISERYSPGVCLVVGSYSFTERGTGRPLRYESADASTETPIDRSGNLLASVDGAGPLVQIEFTGTGFLVAEGLIATNKHVAQPWLTDPIAQIIMRQGGTFHPRPDSLVAFFPSTRNPFELKVVKPSDRFDIALCGFNQDTAALPTLPLGNEDLQSIIGEPVVLLGYPTGVDGLLQRIDERDKRIILAEHGRSLEDVATGLGALGLVRPLTTTGIVSDALPGRIAHSAHTTEGGSGGPLFDREGKVIAINSAILATTDGTSSFGGSNFGVPIKAVLELLQSYKQGESK